MKKLLSIGLSLLLISSLLSCESEQLDGKWDDNIKLSEKEVTVDGEASTIVITTEGTWWWIDGISLNGDWSFDFSDVDTTQDNFLIESDEFTIERKNATEINISLTENQTGSNRILIIGLEAGDYFDSIKITQSPPVN